MITVSIDPQAVKAYLNLSDVNLTTDQVQELSDQIREAASRDIRAKVKATLDKLIAEAKEK